MGVMKDSEKLLASVLLEAAFEVFSRIQVSRDSFSLVDVMPAVSDRRELMRGFSEWDGDPEGFDPEGTYETVDESLLMIYMASKLQMDLKQDPQEHPKTLRDDR